MIKQYQLLALLSILSACRIQGQYYFYNDQYYNTAVLIEAGLSVGGFNCLTDLGGSKGHGKRFVKDINWKNTHIGGGLYVAVLFQQVITLRVEGSLGKVSASDHILKDDESVAKRRYRRNLSFESRVAELSISAEFHPLPCFINESHPIVSPYLLAGAGIFRFNPRAKNNGNWVYLRPLRTEGQGFKEYPERLLYPLTQINFPAGFGLKYEISAIFNARAEVIYRFLKTDYLDDVSTTYIDPNHFDSNLKPFDAPIARAMADRSSVLDPAFTNSDGAIRGNPTNRDAYFSFNIKLGVILNRKHR